MMLRRTWTMARKELRHIARNRLTLFLVTISPALLLLTLSYVFSFNVNEGDLAVMDLDKSPASRSYVSTLTSGDYLSLVADVYDYPALERMLVAGTINAALIIPPGFGENRTAGQPAQVQVLVDGSNRIIASQIMGMISEASREATEVPEAALAFEVRSRAWYNPTLDSLTSMVPGLMGVVLTLPALALALSLTREKELGTLEGLLATPVERPAYLLGKTAAYVMTGTVGLLLSWLIAVGWFRVPFSGDLGLLVLLTVLYFLASMGFSLMIATWISSQQTAMFLVMLVFFVPSFFLAGLIDPIDQSSTVAVALSTPLPATHYIAIARGLFLKGVGMDILLQPALLLFVMALVAVTISAVIFKKKLA